MHYGLLPRANRGIFAINELPDLAGKIQVALFNIMQEGDVQIKGYRCAWSWMLFWSSARTLRTTRRAAKSSRRSRTASARRSARTIPETLEEGIAITAQEAWSERGWHARSTIPQYMREVIEQVAFSAREDKKVDKRSGVSQRLPISTMELVVSNAERRALFMAKSWWCRA